MLLPAGLIIGVLTYLAFGRKRRMRLDEVDPKLRFMWIALNQHHSDKTEEEQ